MTENKGLCYRCEYRAQFHETGHAPRCQCKSAAAVVSCYMYRPVTPLLLLKDKEDGRPQFGGALFSSRSHSGGLADCRMDLEQSKEGSTIFCTPKSLDDLHIKARDMIWFLESHPALGGDIHGLFSLLQVQIEKVDKRGRIEPHKGLEDIYWTREIYKKFKTEFDAVFKDCAPDELKRKPLISIQVPYERVYGGKWAFDHIEYWGELSITAFMGKDFKHGHDMKNWQYLAGIETGGRSFQEMIVNIGTQFKKVHGDFSGQDFLTPQEMKNNKNEEIFFFKDIPNTNHGEMIRNPKYIHVSSAELNRRWWKWFSKTPQCKKQWGDTAKMIISGKEHL